MRRPPGHGCPLLYLDFDGVLHPADVWWNPRFGPHIRSPEGHTLFEHSQLLAEALRPVPDVRIVLSTSWVWRYGLARTTKNLPPEVRSRVIGATWHPKVNRETFAALTRPEQVLRDVRRRGPSAWLAVDDFTEGWPSERVGGFVASHSVDGIGEPTVLAELTTKLLSINPRRSDLPLADPSVPHGTERVVTVVFACVPEFELVYVRAPDGRQFALTPQTDGISLPTLREGQRVECIVTRRLSRVLSAELLT